jgi:hypothetical protein
MVPVFADKGSIPFKPHVKVFEPNQRAMIAWSGEEEILILTTNQKASEPTKVFEVLPLPSEPVVTKGDIEIFKKATDLINTKRKLKKMSMTKGKGHKSFSDEPSGRITFHKVIGAHDVSVSDVKVQNSI